MSEPSNTAHYKTLQVSPAAEPEVIAAAYRALAKKYHPDRSAAPDAMARMAGINAAYQAVGSRSGRMPTGNGKFEPPPTPPPPTFLERVDPNASLEDMLSVITRMMASARQSVIEQVTSDGVARDIATSLVATALRSLNPGSPTSTKDRRRQGDTVLNESASYDDALQAVTRRAQAVRDQLADELARDGLNRGSALELTDMAFEKVRRKVRSSSGAESRLTTEHVDLAGPLDSGVRIVAAKLQAARQMVMDELTRDGIPLRTAQQLIDAAGHAPAGRQSK